VENEVIDLELKELESNQKHLLHTINRIVAWVSGGIGVLILILYAILKLEILIIAGLFCLMIGFWLNLVLLALTIIFIIIHKPSRKQGWITFAFILGNIPLAIICAIIGLSMVS